MQNYALAVRPDRESMTLRIPDPNDWVVARQLAGSVREYTPGEFTYALSTQNLEKIYQVFRNHKRPVVVEGQECVDRLRQELITYRTRVRSVHEILSSERVPIEPNGKFHPYAHQTKAIGVILANPYSPVMLSCGLGKTGSTARAIEICLKEGAISRGKILISAPLSILYSSWMDDVEKFTGLKGCVLWTAQGNKVELGSKVRLGKHRIETEPEGTVKVTKKTHVAYFCPELGKLKKKVTQLDLREHRWIKYQVSYQVALDAQSVATPFGDITGRTAETQDTRTQYLADCLKDSSNDIYLINHDGVRIYEELLTSHGFEWVVVDESTKIKSMEAAITKAHLKVSERAKRRNILSGTPNPNGFEDLWAQYYFLDRGLTLGTSKKDYLHDYFVAEQAGTYTLPNGIKQAIIQYNIRSDRDRDLLIQTARAPGIYLEQRDCIDLPPRTDTHRNVRMTPEQEGAYVRMEKELFTTLDDHKTGQTVSVEAVNMLAKIMKLRQITSGFIVDTGANQVSRIQSPKMSDLDDFIEELGGKKVVVACQFREEIEQLLFRYKKIGVAAIYGGTSLESRTAAIRDFQTTDKVRIMVLQPQAAAHGITLTAASHLVYLSLDYNFEYYYQVAKRIERIGQKSNIFVIHSLATFADGAPTIDYDLWEILGGKTQVRDSLFQPKTQRIDDIVSSLRDRIRLRVLARG